MESLTDIIHWETLKLLATNCLQISEWLGGGPSRCTVECNFGQIVHTHCSRLWCYDLMALYKSV